MNDNQDRGAPMSGIEISLDTPNGPIVEYGDHSLEEIELEVPSGWSVDWETGAVRTLLGRYRSPLVRSK